MIELVTLMSFASSNEGPTSYVDRQILGKDKYTRVQDLFQLDKPDSEEILVVKNEMKKGNIRQRNQCHS